MAKRGTRSRSLRARRRGDSVQRRFVGVRAVQGAVLCLSSGNKGGTTDYVAVLQVAGPSIALSDQEEQWQRHEQFRALLRTLPYGVQILWRLVPRPLSSVLTPLSPDLDRTLAPGEVRSLLPATSREEAAEP